MNPLKRLIFAFTYLSFINTAAQVNGFKANNDTLELMSNQNITIDILFNDSKGDADSIYLAYITPSLNGEVVNNYNGTVTYFPRINYRGNDTIYYRVCTNTIPVLCDDAALFIKIVKPTLPKLFIPNTFTPNGDGINDFFEVKNITLYNASLRIFNRLGRQVYINKKYDNSWNGKIRHGENDREENDLIEGVYYYLFTFVEIDDLMAGYIIIER